MKVIAITGSIACGKSTVIEILENYHGVHCISADAIVHELMKPELPCYKKIVESFGEDILGEKNVIDRKKLAAKVFADPRKLSLLEGIVQPFVIRIMMYWIDIYRTYGYPLVAVEIPLLHKLPGLDILFNEVWVVKVKPEEQLKRLMNRSGCDAEEAARRVAAFGEIPPKFKSPTWTLHNNKSYGQLMDDVDFWVDNLLDSEKI